MKQELFVVPNYECSGVVERYFKSSVRVCNDADDVIGIYSVIINKKTGKVQHQAKVDNLTPKKIRTAIYGYDRTSLVLQGAKAVNDHYANFTDDEKRMLWQTVSELLWAYSINNNPFSPAEKDEVKDFMRQAQKTVEDIRNGNYQPMPVAEATTPEQVAEAPSEATTPEQVAELVKRATKKVARLVFASGLTEFASGNIYDIDLDTDGAPKTILDLNNGKTYFSVKNGIGESRYLESKRLQIVEQFTEPPKA